MRAADPFAVASGLGAMAAVFPAHALYERRAGGDLTTLGRYLPPRIGRVPAGLLRTRSLRAADGLLPAGAVLSALPVYHPPF